MQGRDAVGEVAHMAIGAGILEDRAEDFRRLHLGRVTNDNLDPKRGGAGFHHCDVLRVAVAVDKELGRLRLGHPLRHGHRLGAGGRLVQQGGIGNLQTGQIADHGLKVQQRL